jgi:hypothetical protein
MVQHYYCARPCVLGSISTSLTLVPTSSGFMCLAYRILFTRLMFPRKPHALLEKWCSYGTSSLPSLCALNGPAAPQLRPPLAQESLLRYGIPHSPQTPQISSGRFPPIAFQVVRREAMISSNVASTRLGGAGRAILDSSEPALYVRLHDVESRASRRYSPKLVSKYKEYRMRKREQTAHVLHVFTSLEVQNSRSERLYWRDGVSRPDPVVSCYCACEGKFILHVDSLSRRVWVVLQRFPA